MPDIESPERLRALAVVVMEEHAKIDPNGFDPKRPRYERRAERARLHREFDDIVDRWATARLLIALENA